jgi:hypothetical protein
MMSRFWWGSNVDHKKIHWVNWKNNCKHKNLGGLGFKDLRAFNEAMLAKQGWRIVTEPQSLMARTIKAKYFPHCNFFQAKQGSRPSYSWQSILKASWILKKGCFWIVGNGNNIRIWEDRWINPQAGKSTWTPKPANPTITTVNELIDPSLNRWKTQLISQTFWPIETNQILQIPLPSPNIEDTISWQGTKDGTYTVRSGYNAQIEWETSNNNQPQSSNNQIDNNIWNKLWKIEAPPKQIHLLWRILKKVIPVKANLLTKGIICDSICPICNHSPETIDHTFLHCEWARLVWFYSPLTIATTNSQIPTFADWFIYMLNNANKESLQFIATITYSIWLAQNSLIFKGINIPAEEAVDRAIKTLLEYQHLCLVDRPSPNKSNLPVVYPDF